MKYVLYSSACFFFPGILWMIFARKKLKEQRFVLRHNIWSIIFMLYCYAAIWDAANIGTIWDLFYYHGPIVILNLIPFSISGSATKIQNVLNVFMFIPLGFLLPLIWKEFRKLYKVLLTGMGMSLSIELFQLFSPRVTDIDDLIMNTLGTVAGYFLWLLFKKLFSTAGDKAISNSKIEAFIYIWGGMLGVVLFYNWRLLLN